MGWKWGYILSSRRTREFRADIDWLFKMMKVRYGISKDMVIAQFVDYMEEREGEEISSEAIYSYLQKRANFPFEIGISFLGFLADYDGGKRRKLPEVLDLIQKWYLPIIPFLKKFIQAAEERQRELEEEKKKYDFKF